MVECEKGMVSTSNTKVREGTQPRGLGLSLDPPSLITTDGGVTKWWSDEVEESGDRTLLYPTPTR